MGNKISSHKLIHQSIINRQWNKAISIPLNVTYRTSESLEPYVIHNPNTEICANLTIICDKLNIKYQLQKNKLFGIESYKFKLDLTSGATNLTYLHLICIGKINYNLLAKNIILSRKNIISLVPAEHIISYNKSVRPLIAKFIAHGINIDAIDSLGNTALHYLAKTPYTQLVKMLLDAGANTSITNIRGYTAIEIAEQCNNNDIYRLLSI